LKGEFYCRACMKSSEFILTLLSRKAHIFSPNFSYYWKLCYWSDLFSSSSGTHFTTTYPRAVLESTALTSCVSPTSPCHKCSTLFSIEFYCNARLTYNTWALQAALFVSMLVTTTGTRTKLIVNVEFDVTTGDRMLARRSSRSHSAYFPTSQISAVQILCS
jgi:hypothetical protein